MQNIFKKVIIIKHHEKTTTDFIQKEICKENVAKVSKKLGNNLKSYVRP